MQLPAEKVLIADTDAAYRALLARQLSREGIAYDVASDGWEALQKLSDEVYGVAVTDLTLPVMHGYALIRYLLSVPWRPAIVVCTSISEPRLVRHLMELGVEEVLIKPISAELVAAKIVSIIRKPVDSRWAAARAKRIRVRKAIEQRWRGRLIAEQFYQISTRELAQSPPESPAWQKLWSSSALRKLALDFANNTYFHTKAQWTDNPAVAVARLGPARAAELLLAGNILCTLLAETPSWLSAGRLAWQSWAATLVADLLVRAAGQRDWIHGVLTGAMLFEASRIVLAQTFADQYAEFLQICQCSKLPIEYLEEKELGMTGPAAVGRLLRQSGVDGAGASALEWATRPDEEIHNLPSPIRLPIEWIKAARFFGKIATYDWNGQDLVDVPSPSVVAALNLPSVDLLVRTVQKCAVQWRWDEPNSNTPASHLQTVTLAPPGPVRPITYCHLIKRSKDPVPALLGSLGWHAESASLDAIHRGQPVLTYVPRDGEADHVALPGCDEHRGKFVVFSAKQACGVTLALPCSIATLTDWLSATVGATPASRSLGVTLPINDTKDGTSPIGSSPIEAAGNG